MKIAPSSKQVLLNIVYYMTPLTVFLGIWVPVILHYYVPNIVITEDMIDSARSVPTDSVLDEIQRFFGSNIIKDKKELTASAEMVLKGKIAIPSTPSLAFVFPFNADDLDKKEPGWKLFLARFSIPCLLLRAYEATERDDFLMAAKDVILAFASYERNAWLPKGFLWNDHAIAGRISVLAKFWKLYRNHPDYESEVAKHIFQLVTRSAQLLAKPSHFKFATNHGVMQNLALWQICLAFPALPNVAFYKQLALERMHDQMIFYINDEGVVLEHSAGYHKAGLEFIGMAFRYLTLMNMPIPEEWRVKYAKAKDFYAQLRRPDGSLPMFGDTGGGSFGPFVTKANSKGKSEILNYSQNWIPKQSNSLYPVAGYCVWWGGLDAWPNEEALSQTVVAWSHFPGHTHKHADEMSVLLWAGGQTWWTNIGYWGYGTKGRSEAVSWAGSNAPHLIDENANSVRSTRLKFHGWSEHLSVIDLERRGLQEYVARRQVIQLKPNLWIVIDHTSGKENSRTTTTWTTSQEVSLSEGTIPGSYVLEAEKNSASLTKFLLASEDTNIMQFRGSFVPFAGWAANRPASAIVIEQPGNDSWAVAIWSIQDGISPTSQFKGPPYMENWKCSEKWKIVLPFASSVMNIWREDNRVFVNEDVRGSGSPKEIILSEASQLTNEIADIHTAYENAAKKYPRKRYSYSMARHLKATYFVFIIFLLQEAFFLMYSRISRRFYTGLRGLNLFCWIVVGIWLVTVYL
jgi:hypothetical protein